jgi:hypothetical protein
MAVIEEMKAKEHQYLSQIAFLTNQVEAQSLSYAQLCEDRARYAWRNRELEEEVSGQRRTEQDLLSEMTELNQAAHAQRADHDSRVEWLTAVANAHGELVGSVEARLSEMEHSESEMRRSEQASLAHTTQVQRVLHQALCALPEQLAELKAALSSADRAKGDVSDQEKALLQKGLAQEEAYLFEALEELQDWRNLRPKTIEGEATTSGTGRELACPSSPASGWLRTHAQTDRSNNMRPLCPSRVQPTPAQIVTWSRGSLRDYTVTTSTMVSSPRPVSGPRASPQQLPDCRVI